MITAEDITPLLPQKPPFVMVSKLLVADDTSITTTFIVEEGNVLVDNGIFTEAGLLENIAQTAAAGAGYKASVENKPVQNGYIGAVKNFVVFTLPKIGDELRTEVSETGAVFNMQMIEGRVWCGEKLLAQCEMKIFLQEEGR